MDLDFWVETFNIAVDKAVGQPFREIATTDKFSDWRITYGVQTEGVQVNCSRTYFLSFYPAFCTKPKGTFHYTNVAELASDVIAMGELTEKVNIPFSDVVATICSYMRVKESIELFKEQKELMTLGLKHYHLDNFYQDKIKSYVDELYTKGTVRDVKVNLTIFKNLKKEG